MAFKDELDPVKKAISDDNPELARNLLRLLIKDYPDSADVWYWSAQVAVNQKQRVAFLEKAVDLDPLHHKAANELFRLQNPIQPIQPVEPVQSASSQDNAIPDIPYADFWRRAVALLIDGFIMMMVIAPIVSLLWMQFFPDMLPDTLTIASDSHLFAIFVIPIYLIQAIYAGYFLSRHQGQTPGKMLLRIRVVKRDETVITVWEAILRNVIGYQLSLIIPGAGFLWMFVDGQSQTWHDLVSNTIVVTVE